MSRPLLVAALAWTALDLAHLYDHLRLDRPVTTEVQVLGSSGYVATALLLLLVLRRHRFAPHYATVFGLSVLAGFTAVHLLPPWSSLSDSYADFDPDALSWALVLAPMAAAAALAVLGARGIWPRRARRAKPSALAD